MTQINKREREAILAQFPSAEIARTRHKIFLVGDDKSQPGRLLLELRGITPPPTRKDKAHGVQRRIN